MPRTIIGTQATDYLYGSNQGEYIQAFASPAFWQTLDRQSVSDTNDMIWAGGGNDTVLAGGGADFVDGGNGRDVIDGGSGNDTLVGGNGADVFDFNLIFASPGSPTLSGGTGAGNRDIILDFQQGCDRIDVSGWQNYEFAPGAIWTADYPPSFGLVLSVGYHYEGDNTIVDIGHQLRPGLDVYIESDIELVGHYQLQTSDFIF